MLLLLVAGLQVAFLLAGLPLLIGRFVTLEGHEFEPGPHSATSVGIDVIDVGHQVIEIAGLVDDLAANKGHEQVGSQAHVDRPISQAGPHADAIALDPAHRLGVLRLLESTEFELGGNELEFLLADSQIFLTELVDRKLVSGFLPEVGVLTHPLGFLVMALIFEFASECFVLGDGLAFCERPVLGFRSEFHGVAEFGASVINASEHQAFGSVHREVVEFLAIVVSLGVLFLGLAFQKVVDPFVLLSQGLIRVEYDLGLGKQIHDFLLEDEDFGLHAYDLLSFALSSAVLVHRFESFDLSVGPEVLGHGSLLWRVR